MSTPLAKQLVSVFKLLYFLRGSVKHGYFKN